MNRQIHQVTVLVVVTGRPPATTGLPDAPRWPALTRPPARHVALGAAVVVTATLWRREFASVPRDILAQDGAGRR